MVRCEVIEKFTLGNDKRYRFEDLKELQRKDFAKDNFNTLYVGDRFICNDEMALYLTGKNPIRKVVIKAIEVIPIETKVDEPLDEEGNIIPDEVAKEVPVEKAKEIVKKSRTRKKKE